MPVKKLCLVTGLFLLLLADDALSEEKSRVWTSLDGRVLVASLLRSDEQSVTLKLVDGRETVVSLDRLSERDRAYLAGLQPSAPTVILGAMPAATSIDPNVPVSGGPQTFSTPHFVFESDSALTKTFVSEASRVFEGTLAAVERLPLGIVPKPAEGQAKFRARFMARDTFEKEYRARNEGQDAVSVQQVAGAYVPGQKQIMVPYTSLGMTASASYVVLRREKDLGTLIHEITHQVMHDWLPIMPTWVSEGLACYLSAMPYDSGRFEFKYTDDGLKKSLQDDHGIAPGQSVSMPSPSTLIEKGSAGWSGDKDAYLSAMLMVYFFIHLDQPDKPCATLANYLHQLDRGRQDTDQFIANYNGALKSYEEKRQAYNLEVKAYNEALEKFQTDAAAYNQRVKQYNDQVRTRVPPALRVNVGEKPVQPVPPENIELPTILKENPNNGEAVDFLANIQTDARPALYRNRDGAALDAAFRLAYLSRGIPIIYEDQSP